MGMGPQVSDASSRTPLVSVGLPVFNGEADLRQALDSILAQTFPDFELIVSDNASTDGTAAILREYAARDSRIRCFFQPCNIGAGNNYTFVARQARGVYLKWASANDEYAPALIARSLSLMQSDPDVVLCYGRTQFIDESGRRLQVHERDFEAPMADPVARYRIARTQFELGTPAQSGLIRLDALRQCRYLGNFLHSDRVLIAELALHGRIILLPEVLFFRRLGEGIATPLRSPIELERMFDPRARRTPVFVNFRVHAGHLAAVARAPISFRDRIRVLVAALRYANWERRYLFAEIGAFLRRMLASLSNIRT